MHTTSSCIRFLGTLVTALATTWHAGFLYANEEEAKDSDPPQEIQLADGNLTLPVPASWEKVDPRSRMIAYEFTLPAVEEGGTPGRMTIMSAGGGVEANIKRWVGQFQTTEGKPIGEDAKQITKKQVSGITTHLVDLSGEYQDQPRGPFGPKINPFGLSNACRHSAYFQARDMVYQALWTGEVHQGGKGRIR